MEEHSETPSPQPVEPDAPAPSPEEEPEVTPEEAPATHTPGESGQPAPGSVLPVEDTGVGSSFTREEFNEETDTPPNDHHEQGEDPPDLAPEDADG